MYILVYPQASQLFPFLKYPVLQVIATVLEEQVAVLAPQASQTPLLMKNPDLHDYGTGPIQVVAFPGHA